MAPAIQILQINLASDGTGATPVTSVGMVRNDGYFLEKIAEEWAKERGLPSGLNYRLDQLPPGYGGFERSREKNSKHIDRYLYGHPRGAFRSLRELYPHFKHLQQHHNSQGCPCKLCTGPAKRASDVGSTSSGSNAGKPIISTVPAAVKVKARPKGSLLLHPPDIPIPAKQKQIDELGTPDVFRALLTRLKATGSLDEPVVDTMSPDWRVGHSLLTQVLNEWQSLPGYVPRGGEIVLFSRSFAADEEFHWDETTRSLRQIKDGEWLDRPVWEAGVVTQMPIEPVTLDDLSRMADGKTRNITYSGFRIEPLSQPGNEEKSLTRQHKYIPLHALRPFTFWRECIGDRDVQSCHVTIRHALTVACSFCVIGKSQFKGTWPDATIFARGVYLGADLILVGDTVRLLPRAGYQPEDAVTDIMVVTSIRLRFVNLEEASENDYDDGQPYTTCLHISGRVFTLDPERSFDGSGRSPVKPAADHSFPVGMQGYGQWFHVLDPLNPKARLEVPYTRVAGRCYDRAVLKAWFPTSSHIPAGAVSSVAVNSPARSSDREVADIAQGLMGLRKARNYSLEHDVRIDKDGGKTWFWADSRIEQLDLHEINDRYVGAKDPTRTTKKMNILRQALKLLDGKKGSLEEYLAERRRLKDVQGHGEAVAPASSAWGLVAGSALDQSADSSSDHDMGQEVDAMEIDEDNKGIRSTPRTVQAAGGEIARRDIIQILDDSDDDSMYD